MKQRGGRFLLILGAALALMAFVVVYALTSKGIAQSSQAASVPTPPPTKLIAVVNQDVPAYTILDATNVGTLEVDASTALSDTVDTPSLVYGKLVTTALSRNQPVLTNQLTTSGFSQVLSKGKRVFTLAVPERNNFGGMLTENDYVDVLWSHKFAISQFVAGIDGKPQEVKQDLPTVKTMLQDVRVMKVMSLLPPATPASGQSQGDAQPASSKKTAPSTVANYAPDASVSTVLLLEVTDQQAEVLKFCNENGTLDFVMRSTDGTSKRGEADVKGDHDPERTTGITDKVLVEQYGLLLPEVIVK